MKVIYEIGKVEPPFKKAVLSIGVFDGLHIGHQELIQRTVNRAKELRGDSVVFTFSPHPVEVLNPSRYLPLIVPLPQRLSLMEAMKVDYCIVIHFTKRFSRLSPESFIKRYIVKYIKPLEIFVGSDFRFGNKRAGTLAVFHQAGEKYGFRVNVVHSVEKKKEKISSTHIRHLIHEGKLKETISLLGRKFSIMGVVEKGQSMGAQLGFPTANIYPDNEILPPSGVYAVFVYYNGKKFKGMANVGIRPTFNKSDQNKNVEVHIFHFRQNLIGKMIEIEFLKKIREERMFPSEEKLIQQLKQDEKRVKAFFDPERLLPSEGR